MLRCLTCSLSSAVNSCISVKSLAECIQNWFTCGFSGAVTFLAPGHLRVQSVASTTLLHSTVRDLQMLRTQLRYVGANILQLIVASFQLDNGTLEIAGGHRPAIFC